MKSPDDFILSLDDENRISSEFEGEIVTWFTEAACVYNTNPFLCSYINSKVNSLVGILTVLKMARLSRV